MQICTFIGSFELPHLISSIMKFMKTKATLISCVLMTSFLITVYGDNPELSFWLKNISEPYDANNPVLSDYASELAISGSTIHVLWLADGPDYEHYIFYRRSHDNGLTWDEKIKFEEVEQNGIDHGATSKRMGVSGDYVHIVYSRHSPYNEIIYLRSTDGGATFDPPRILHEALHVSDLYVSVSGSNISVFLFPEWIEGTMVVMNSSDNGETFLLGEIGETPDATLWDICDLVRDGNYIYALSKKAYYYYGLQYGELYFSVSSDGIVFQNQKISIPSANGNDKTFFMHDYNYNPKMAVSGSHVCVIWSGLDGEDNHNVFVRHSPDRGQTWDEVINLSQGILAPGETPQAGQEAIVAKGNAMYATFLSTSSHIYASSSGSSGASFSAMKKITAPGDEPHISGGWWPNCTIDPNDPTGQTAYFIWSYPVYVCTRDGGNTYSKPVTIGTQYSWKGGTKRPRICIGEDSTIHYITEGQYYMDGYYRDSDIFYRRLDVAPEPSDDAALKLNYVSQGERYDNMAIPSSPSFQCSEQITLEAWIKPEPGTNKVSRIVTKEDAHSWTYSPKAYQLATHDYAGGRYANAGIRTTTGEYVNWGGEIIEGEWNHIAMTYNSLAGENNFILYLNGQRSTSVTVTGNLTVGDGMLIIGPVRDSDGFSGLIDEVRIWDRALPEELILSRMYAELHGNETGLVVYYNFNNTTKDITGHGNDGILMYKEEFVESVIVAPDSDQDGVSDLGEWGPGGNDYDFDGNDDGIPDWKQGNVASLHTYLLDRYVTVAVVPEVGLVDVIPVEGPGFTPGGYAFPYGFFEFTLQFNSSRAATTVDLYLHDGQAVNSYFNYGPLPELKSPDWYEFLYDQQTGATLVENKVTLAFVDGLRGDHDLTADGTVVTMGGPAKESEGIGELDGGKGRLRVLPNPCSDYLEIKYNSPVSGNMRLDLLNAGGEKVRELISDKVNPGETLFRFSTRHLDDGVYYLRLDAGTYQEVKKVIVIQ